MDYETHYCSKNEESLAHHGNHRRVLNQARHVEFGFVPLIFYIFLGVSQLQP